MQPYICFTPENLELWKGKGPFFSFEDNLFFGHFNMYSSIALCSWVSKSCMIDQTLLHDFFPNT